MSSSLSEQLSGLILNQEQDIDLEEDLPLMEEEDEDMDSESVSIDTEVSDTDQDSESLSDDEEVDSSLQFQIVPFAGLVKQSITVVVDLNSVEDLRDYNFQNPFSKKQGIFRELMTKIKPFMVNLANKEVLLLTSNLLDCRQALRGLFVTNINSAAENLLGSIDGINYNVVISSIIDSDFGSPSLSIDTRLKMSAPSLAKSKNDNTLRNIFVYFDRLAESMPKVSINLIFGFSTLQLVDVNIRPTLVSTLLDMVSASSSSKMFVPGSNTPCPSDIEGFDLVFVKTWNE